MMRIGQLLTLLLGLLASGCAAEQVAVTYDCDPAGAMLYSGNRPLGRCPKTLFYDITPEARESGKVVLQAVGARYASGFQFRTKKPYVIDLKNGLKYRINLVRPQDKPGYETDARYALEYERNQLLREQAGASARAANAAEATYWNKVFDDAFSPLGAGYQPGAVGSCTSQDLGGIITTNCY